VISLYKFLSHNLNRSYVLAERESKSKLLNNLLIYLLYLYLPLRTAWFTCKKSDKLRFAVKHRGSVNVGRIKVRIMVRV